MEGGEKEDVQLPFVRNLGGRGSRGKVISGAGKKKNYLEGRLGRKGGGGVGGFRMGTH